jgi:hypothetical protein
LHAILNEDMHHWERFCPLLLLFKTLGGVWKEVRTRGTDRHVGIS